MTSYLTTRDCDLLECLMRQVPFLSFVRIARHWWGASVSAQAARKRIRFLRRAGLLLQRIINAPCQSVQKLDAWRPNEPSPDFVAIHERVQRSLKGGSVPIEMYEASRLAANCFGHSPWRVPDLALRQSYAVLSEVFAQYRLCSPEKARSWFVLKSDSENSASAVLLDEQNRPFTRIFPVLSASPGKLEKLHRRCWESDLPYELWGGAA